MDSQFQIGKHIMFLAGVAPSRHSLAVPSKYCPPARQTPSQHEPSGQAEHTAEKETPRTISEDYLMASATELNGSHNTTIGFYGHSAHSLDTFGRHSSLPTGEELVSQDDRTGAFEMRIDHYT